MRSIAVVNEKGGPGKTTGTVTLASALASIGKTVIVIDTDPQGHAGLSLGIDKQPSLYELLVRKKTWDAPGIVYDVPASTYALNGQSKGQLFIVPGNIETRGIPQSLSESDSDFVLLDRLTQVAGFADYIIFDTAPTPLGGLATMILMATDAILYVTEPNTLSLDGLAESRKRVKPSNRKRRAENLPPIDVAGILPNKTVMRTIVHSANLTNMLDAFGRGKVYSPVAHRTAWEKAVQAQKSIFAHNIDDQAVRSAVRFADEFLVFEGYEKHTLANQVAANV